MTLGTSPRSHFYNFLLTNLLTSCLWLISLSCPVYYARMMKVTKLTRISIKYGDEVMIAIECQLMLKALLHFCQVLPPIAGERSNIYGFNNRSCTCVDLPLIWQLDYDFFLIFLATWKWVRRSMSLSNCYTYLQMVLSLNCKRLILEIVFVRQS